MLTVVIDPGHGGTANLGGSDWNHAKSPSGVLEKDMTLALAQAVKAAIDAEGVGVRVLLTRNSDTNLSLRDRARIAADQRAEVFLSIHFNGFNGNARGSETWIQSVANGNLNYIADEAFARRVQSAVFGTLSRHDANARNRGIKEDKVLSVITDPYLGNSVTAATCRACLAEIEFIDVPAVDALLNTGATANLVRAELAAALKIAILGELQVAAQVRSLQPVRRRKRKKRAKKKKRASAVRRRPS